MAGTDEGTDATLHELAHTRIGKVALAAQMASVLGMLPFLWIEVATVAAYGLSMWAHVFKTIDLLAYILQVLVLWIKVLYFSRVLQPHSSPFVETVREVMQEVKWFLALLIIVGWGFACSFYILFRQNQKAEEYSTIGRAVVHKFQMLIGGADMEIIWNSPHPVMGLVFMFLYVSVLGGIGLPCLIAVMSEVYSR
eukprot:jgi/Astpho2/8490/Aster-x0358